jgi:hypothetical protein
MDCTSNAKCGIFEEELVFFEAVHLIGLALFFFVVQGWLKHVCRLRG